MQTPKNVDAEKCSKLDKFSFDGFKFLGKIVEPETTCNRRGYYTGEQQSFRVTRIQGHHNLCKHTKYVGEYLNNKFSKFLIALYLPLLQP